MARQMRSDATRETEIRAESWVPANTLPSPHPQEGWKFRWKRKTIYDFHDVSNMSKGMREGWVPCRLEDHPELANSVDMDAKNSGLVEFGGLILCKIPEERALARNAYYTNLANAQIESVEANLLGNENKSMPMFVDRKSTVSFGKGS